MEKTKIRRKYTSPERSHDSVCLLVRLYARDVILSIDWSSSSSSGKDNHKSCSSVFLAKSLISVRLQKLSPPTADMPGNSRVYSHQPVDNCLCACESGYSEWKTDEAGDLKLCTELGWEHPLVVNLENVHGIWFDEFRSLASWSLRFLTLRTHV